MRSRPVSVRAVPGGRLSSGMTVDACISARLLGFRLLTLDAHLTFLPATPAIPEQGLPAASSTPRGSLSDAVDILLHATQTLDQVRT